MQTTLKKFIDTVIKKNSDIDIQQEGAKIIEQLEVMIFERSNILAKNQRTNKQLPSTNLTFIDGIFEYMLIKATEKDIDFELNLTGNIKYMVENIIPEDYLRTLIADHLDNSIIAININMNRCKKIFVILGVSSEYYELTIKDSGIPFEIDTLLSLGKQQTTTHANNGGSGIGFMSTFKILQETKASIIIEEYQSPNCSYSKKITIKFDRKNEYRINSFRSDELKSKCQRNDIIINSIAPVYNS